MYSVARPRLTIRRRAQDTLPTASLRSAAAALRRTSMQAIRSAQPPSPATPPLAADDVEIEDVSATPESTTLLFTAAADVPPAKDWRQRTSARHLLAGNRRFSAPSPPSLALEVQAEIAQTTASGGALAGACSFPADDPCNCNLALHPIWQL